MSADLAQSFLAALLTSGLLTPEARRSLEAGAPYDSPQALARAAHRRGWLTEYQLRQVSRGRAADLVVGDYHVRQPLEPVGTLARLDARDPRDGSAVRLLEVPHNKPLAESLPALAAAAPDVLAGFRELVPSRGRHYLALDAIADADAAWDAAVTALIARPPGAWPQSPEAAREFLAAHDLLPTAEDDGGFTLPAADAPATVRATPRRAGVPWGLTFLVGGLALGVVAIGVVVGTVVVAPEPVPQVATPDPNANPLGMAFVALAGVPTDGQPPVPFAIGVTEVSQHEYSQLMPKSPAKWAISLKAAGRIPVDSVTFGEAVAFCERLTERSPQSGGVYRLPTEAEWEYACAAGTTTRFSSGEVLVYGRGGVFNLTATRDLLGEPDVTRPKMETGFPYPVATSDPNAFGLRDCHGNVWEWTASPQRPESAGTPGARRAIRGGSWRTGAAQATTKSRDGLAPETRRDDVGFRVAWSPRDR